MNAGDWPQNYVVQKNSESPDGRYGVLVLSKQAAIDQDQTEGNSTYLANLRTRQTPRLNPWNGLFRGTKPSGFDCGVVAGLEIVRCNRLGTVRFASSSVVKPKDSTFAQTDVGERIKQSLNTVLRKQSHDSEISGEASPHFRLNSDERFAFGP